MIRFPFRPLLAITLLPLLLSIPLVSHAQEEPVVRAVLFYPPTCPHCHQVINEVLMPLVEEHGERLQIVAIDVTQAGGQALYQSAIEHFAIPEERLGVPTLIVSDTVLVGSGEIPAQFPAILGDGLATGVDWPAIPGFAPPAAEAVAAATPAASATPLATMTTGLVPSEETAGAPAAAPAAAEIEPTATAGTRDTAPAASESPLILDGRQPQIASGVTEEPPADPLGFALASAVLLAMLIACAYVILRLIIPFIKEGGLDRLAAAELSWAVPLIAVFGIGVAAYLAYVEVNQVTAVCGPIGHCNLVQSSPYARLMGIPIAILGIASYLAIIVLWIVERLANQQPYKTAARLGLIGLAVAGTLFSIYLTLLELFVVRAVCAWCLTSAVFITLLMVLVVRPARNEPELVAS